MRFPALLLLAALAATGISAQQAGTAPAPPKPAPDSGPAHAAPAKPEASQPSSFFVNTPYIRRFTAGGNMSFLVLGLMRGGKQSETITTPPVQIDTENESKGTFFGGGLTMQFFLTDRYAVNADLQVRRLRYRLTTRWYEGVDNPNTTGDDRTLTTFTEDTRARYYDIPLLIRRYNESRFEEKWKWFYEAGPTLRHVSHIRSSLQTEKGSTTSCCDETPATPAKTNIFGATAGIGLVLKDDFGIKIVPEFRYTRWLGGIFNSRAARSRRDQYEAVFTITF